jgi:hypothetical protein
MRLDRAGAAAERAADRAAQLVFEQNSGKPRVGEIGLGQGQPDAQQRVLAQPLCLADWGSGSRQRVPSPAGTVGGQVLHRVHQVHDAAEEPTHLGQCRLVGRPTSQHCGMGKHGRGRGFGRLGDGQHGTARAGRRFHLCLPADRAGQHRRIKTQPAASFGV